MNLIADFLNLFYPEVCHACSNTLNAGEKMICTDCYLNLPFTQAHLLPASENLIGRRFFGRLPVENVLPFLTFSKESRVQQLLHNLKYRNLPEIGNFLGNWYGMELKNEGYSEALDLVLPVPLHKYKERQRGYNQSDKFAEGLSDALEIPWCADTIKRIIASSTQTRKSRSERWENVEKIFEVNKKTQISDKSILLVDDVLTTGATLEACGQELLRNGCKRLTVATIAIA